MRIWIESPNPFALAEPPAHVQQAIFDYDKMLRLFASQTERVYRLARVVRREAQLGLSAMVVHRHPDTITCINHGVVPVSALMPWAITVPHKIIRDLRARDTWAVYGGDPNKYVDALETAEADVEAKQKAEADADLDERSANAYRAIRYGRPTQTQATKIYDETVKALEDVKRQKSDAAKKPTIPSQKFDSGQRGTFNTVVGPDRKRVGSDRSEARYTPSATPGARPPITVID